MASEEIEKGDKVSWQWGGGAPGGVVEETKKEGEIAIESNKGNIIKKNADPENPAVHIARPGNDVVKRASELTVEEKKDASSDAPKEDPPKEDTTKQEANPEEPTKNGASEQNGVTDEKSAGEKREREADDEGEKGEEKKQKTEEAAPNAAKDEAPKPVVAEKPNGVSSEAKENGEKKNPGRPKTDQKEAKAKKPKKERPPPSTEGIGSRTRSRAKA